MPRRSDIRRVMIIGSGPIVIGQACEFDYSGTQACKALRGLGYQIVLVNSNPATIMTDPAMADATYIEPLNLDAVAEIIAKERPDALLPNLGGQTGLNLASELARAGVLDKYGVRVIGVDIDAIERGEDRVVFKQTMESLGIQVPRSEAVYSVEDAEKLRGQDLTIPSSELSRLPEGQYYTFQIIGLDVLTTDGEHLGQIVDIMATASNDVYIVEGKRGKILIPAIEDVVKSIDLDKGEMVIEAIEGLLD